MDAMKNMFCTRKTPFPKIGTFRYVQFSVFSSIAVAQDATVGLARSLMRCHKYKLYAQASDPDSQTKTCTCRRCWKITTWVLRWTLWSMQNMMCYRACRSKRRMEFGIQWVSHFSQEWVLDVVFGVLAFLLCLPIRIGGECNISGRSTVFLFMFENFLAREIVTCIFSNTDCAWYSPPNARMRQVFLSQVVTLKS